MTSLPHLMSKVISEVKQIQRIPNKRVFKNWGTISPMSSRFPSQSSVGPSAVLVEKKKTTLPIFLLPKTAKEPNTNTEKPKPASFPAKANVVRTNKWMIMYTPSMYSINWGYSIPRILTVEFVKVYRGPFIKMNISSFHWHRGWGIPPEYQQQTLAKCAAWWNQPPLSHNEKSCNQPTLSSSLMVPSREQIIYHLGKTGKIIVSNMPKKSGISLWVPRQDRGLWTDKQFATWIYFWVYFALKTDSSLGFNKKHQMIELKQYATNIKNNIYYIHNLHNIEHQINFFINLPELPNPAPEGPPYHLLAETTSPKKSPVLVKGVTAQMKTTSTLAYLHLALKGS